MPHTTTRLPVLSLLAAVAVLTTACSHRPQPPVAVAALAPASGSQAQGTVRFTQEEDRIVVHAHVAGLAPNSEHGFHVHEKGDCTAPDASSAGAHLNPDGKPHGSPAGVHHTGDLPSLKADASGVAQASFEIKGMLLGSGAQDLLGKAVVVHADPDDYHSQPAGNSGARIACGVIATPVKPGGLGGDAGSRTIPKQM